MQNAKYKLNATQMQRKRNENANQTRKTQRAKRETRKTQSVNTQTQSAHNVNKPKFTRREIQIFVRHAR